MAITDGGPASPNLNYSLFLNFKSVKNAAALITATAAAIEAIYNGWAWFSRQINPSSIPLQTLDRVALIVQTTAIIVLVFARPRLPSIRIDDTRTQDESVRLRDATKASEQFLGHWAKAWVAWLVLYVVLCLVEFRPAMDSVWTHLAMDACNFANACYLFLCFQTMVVRSTGEFEQSYQMTSLEYTVACGVIIIAEFLTISSFQDKCDAYHAQLYFQCANGVMSAIAISLLVGRFESSWIRTNLILIVLLYAYASIQILFPLVQIFGPGLGCPKAGQDIVSRGDEYRSVLTTMALVGKIALFVEIGRITTSGVLTYYMYEYRLQYDKSDQRTEFLRRNFLHT